MMLAATEIKDMSLTQRLQAMEMLWESLAPSPEQVESPAWHMAVLEKGLKMFDSGWCKFLSLRELKDRLNKKHG
jgi:hypothetical protein